MNLLEKADEKKALLDEARPFKGEILNQLRDYYRIGLTWSSNAIEGNSLTLSETKVVLEDGLTVGGRPLRDIYETAGHAEAYDFMFSLVLGKSVLISDIKEMHRLFYKSIDEKNAGSWRAGPVIVTGTDYIFPEPWDIPELMAETENWAKTEREKLHPIEFAALLHLKLVTVHPFIDGNGRVARLCANLALLQDGCQPAVIPPVCRAGYLDAIRAYQQKGIKSLFIDFIAERVIETEKEIIRLLHIN
jgi:Fic family protein